MKTVRRRGLPVIPRVVLRAAADSDFVVLAELRNNFAVQDALLATGRPNSPARVKAWLERRAADDEGVFFVIAATDDDRALGFVQATGIDPLHRVAELGICITDVARGRGVGRQAIALLEEYLQRSFRTRKIWLRVDAGNTNAIALYGACGFQRVGVLSQHHYAGGRYRDVLIMEKLFAKQRTTLQ